MAEKITGIRRRMNPALNSYKNAFLPHNPFDRNFFLNLPYGINVDFPAAPSYGNSSVEFRRWLLISSVGYNLLLLSNKDCLMIL